MKISTHIFQNCFQKSNIMGCLNKLFCRGILSKISLDMLPFGIIPLLMFLSSYSLYIMVGVFIGTALFLFYVRRRLWLVRPRSAFFLVWIISSVIWLTLVFNIFVIMLLEILPEENFLLVALTFAGVGCLYQAKMKAQKTLLPFNKSSYINGDPEKEEDAANLLKLQNEQPYFCRHCQANVPNNKNHSIWLDCCVGPENETWFVFGSFFGMLAFFYGSNLTLTTICHPFIFYYPYIKFLLPDDCSDVYSSATNAVSFASAMYSMIIACKMMCYLLKVIFIKVPGFLRTRNKGRNGQKQSTSKSATITGKHNTNRICSDHFEERHMFLTKSGFQRLHHNALPVFSVIILFYFGILYFLPAKLGMPLCYGGRYKFIS